MGLFCPSHQTIFEQLEAEFPGRPFLALGQTAFWDEPMKAGVALCARDLGFPRPFVAGVHDTDYFARHGSQGATPGYFALPHNDTTTKDLWSAAGEFSCLFGSESVVTREKLLKAGVRLGKVARARKTILDEATEAFGWRGVVFNGQASRVIAETSLDESGPALIETLDWAIRETINTIPGCQRGQAKEQANRLHAIACELACDRNLLTVADFYEASLKPLYQFVAGEEVEMQATRTTRLLQFNKATCVLPRFRLVEAFLNPATRERAKQAYNEIVLGTEVYSLPRFGSFALPFELVVPGKGRGTIRVAPRGVWVMTPQPLFLPSKAPIESVADLARVIEERLGLDCVLIGKAITLLGMLAEEFVFVFHEGASGYSSLSRRLHKKLIEGGVALNPSPILRVKYETWDAWGECDQWIALPEPLRQPFGVEELTTSSFALRWEEVIDQQEQLLIRLGELKSPIELIRFLGANYSQSWKSLSAEYEAIHRAMEDLNRSLKVIRDKKKEALNAWKEVKQLRAQNQIEMGKHWRAELFEKSGSVSQLQKRAEFRAMDQELAQKAKQKLDEWKALQREQEALVRSGENLERHAQRRNLELEAELKRLKLVRQAWVSKSLRKAGFRPSAWWFPLICPDGEWFKKTTATADYSLDPLK